MCLIFIMDNSGKRHKISSCHLVKSFIYDFIDLSNLSNDIACNMHCPEKMKFFEIKIKWGTTIVIRHVCTNKGVGLCSALLFLLRSLVRVKKSDKPVPIRKKNILCLITFCKSPLLLPLNVI